MNHKILNGGLLNATTKISFTTDEKKRRNIVFDIWRHHEAKMANLVDARTLDKR